MTRIAIVETGRPPATLIPRHGDYPDMFGALLGDGLELARFDAQAGDLPDAAAFDGAIISGSAAGVYEDAPWIAELLEWIRSARGRTRLVGVCFGHQAMGQALGGQVEKSDKGWGVGLHRYEVVSDAPWMRPSAPSAALPVSHQDQVVAKPAEARVLLRSDFTPYAGLAWGDDAISFQGHPEFTPAYARDLVEQRRGARLSTELADRAVRSLEEPNDRALVGGWIRGFLAGSTR